mgnify:FL=1
MQDGWLGHILPFDLVQTTHLNTELKALKKQENRLVAISAEFEALLDSLSEEEKEQETINDSGDGFVNAIVAKEAKQLRAEAKQNGAFDDESYEAKIIKADALINEEKALKKSVKEDAEALHLKTKETIEKLTDEEVNTLLELKWITPFLNELHQLPSHLIHQLTRQVQALADKYATTYAKVAQDIKTTEQALANLIDELTGNEFDLRGLAELKAFLLNEKVAK